jgi:hypothetical protein
MEHIHADKKGRSRDHSKTWSACRRWYYVGYVCASELCYLPVTWDTGTGKGKLGVMLCLTECDGDVREERRS